MDIPPKDCYFVSDIHFIGKSSANVPSFRRSYGETFPGGRVKSKPPMGFLSPLEAFLFGEVMPVAEERAKRKLSAIMSADVKGYSRLMRKDEAIPILGDFVVDAFTAPRLIPLAVILTIYGHHFYKFCESRIP